MLAATVPVPVSAPPMVSAPDMVSDVMPDSAPVIKPPAIDPSIRVPSIVPAHPLVSVGITD